MNLDGIRTAAGLSDEDSDTLDALLTVHQSHISRNRKLVRYYEADVTPAPIGVDTFPETVHVDVHCDWPKKAVTSVSERSRFDGFVFGDGSTDDLLDEIVATSGLVGAYNRNVHSELIHGCMFATVGLDSKGRAIVRFHTAEGAAAIWDDAEGRIGAGFVIARKRRTGWSKYEPVPVQVNMHLPGRVVMLTRSGVSRWDAESAELPIDRPAMESFAFRANGLKPFGSSRIDKTVMSITDDVIRTRQNMAVSAALYAAPQKHILGLTEDQFDALVEDRWKAYIGSVFLSTRDEDGNVPTVGQLSPASPQPFIDIIRLDAMTFSGATGVPLNSLGIVYDNPSSAEAIAASREDICIAASDLNESNGESLRNVALVAMAVANNSSIDDLSDVQRSVVARFSDPSMPSVVSQADAAVKIASAAPFFAESDVFFEMLGFSEADRRRLAGERAMSSANDLLAAFATSPQQQAAQPAAEV